MLDPMFEIPGSNICSVEITDDVVLGNSPPNYVRTAEETANNADDFESGAENRAVNN